MKLLLDEMYPPQIAELLRRAGHDAVSVHERPLLRSTPDPTIYAAAQTEARVVITNNARDYAVILRESAKSGASHHGVIFTSDRSLPRSRNDIGRYAEVLDDLMCAHPDDDALSNRVVWLKKPA